LAIACDHPFLRRAARSFARAAISLRLHRRPIRYKIIARRFGGGAPSCYQMRGFVRG
jgi:hypothetical protein